MHYLCGVILPKDTVIECVDDIEALVAEALEPFNECFPHSGAKLDYHSIGGAWKGLYGKRDMRRGVTAKHQLPLPAAIVTPDGEWYEKYVRFDTPTCPREGGEWNTRAYNLIHEYRAHWVVAVDCHC